MIGYTIPVSCPCCDSPLEHVVASKVHAGSDCSAVARCEKCAMDWSVHVQLRMLEKRRKGRAA